MAFHWFNAHVFNDNDLFYSMSPPTLNYTLEKVNLNI